MPDADPTGRPGMPGTGPEQTEHEQTGEREGRADARRHAGCGGLDMHLPQPTTYRAKTAEDGAADIFLEIITQPFLGFDGIVPGSSNQATV